MLPHKIIYCGYHLESPQLDDSKETNNILSHGEMMVI